VRNDRIKIWDRQLPRKNEPVCAVKKTVFSKSFQAFEMMLLSDNISDVKID